MKKIKSENLLMRPFFTIASIVTSMKNKSIRCLVILAMLAIPIAGVNIASAASQPASVILAFDDGWNYVLNNAKPIMDANNQKGVAFIITIQPDLAWNGLPNNYMNRAQLSQLYNAGWDLSSHSMTHGGYGAYCFVEPNTPCNENYLSQANNSQLEYELGESKAWLDNNGFKNGSMFFAYPYGYYDAYLVSQIKAAGYYVAARTVDAYSWRYPTPEKPMKHPNYKIGDSDVLEMATYMVAGVTDANDNVTTPQMIMDEINSTVSESGTLILTFHKIVTGTPSVSEEYNVNDFAKISAFLKTMQDKGKLKVVTMSDYFGVPNPIPTYMPSTPLLVSNNIGKDSINITWADAPGNKTDVYDLLVNNNIIYNVVNRSINITGLAPGSSVNVQVYAINRSWGWTSKNSTPLVVNASITIERYTPPTPIDMTIPGSTNLSWGPGIGNKTDYYNYSVNGTWHNNSGDTFYNLTDSNLSKTVLVYAVNSTNGPTINNTPLVIVYNGLNSTRYEPSTPSNISSIIGSDWILTKWEPGNGSNKTDMYDVNINGSWINGSLDNFVNVTNLTAGGYTLVSVYAVNTTNGRTVNSTPAILNSTIPIVNATPTPTSTPAPHSGGGSSGSSGSSGSGGGGGGGSFFDPNAESFERVDTGIYNGTESVVKFTKNKLVTEITLVGIKNYGEVTAVVSLLKKNPTNVSIDGAYKFFSVNMGTIKQENEKLFFKNVTVTISLSKANITGKNVNVYEFVNGSWILTNIEEITGTDKDRYFRLRAAGFSNFAIVFDSGNSGSNPSLSVVRKTDAQTEPTTVMPAVTTVVPKKSPGFDVGLLVGTICIIYILGKKKNRNY